MIRALIFDFDGTIIDTESLDYQCWCEIYREHGQELELEKWVAVVGTTYDRFDPVHYLESKHGQRLDRDALFRSQASCLRSRASELQIGEPVRRLISDAYAVGLKLAVASSASRAWVSGHLERLGLTRLFDCVRCRDDAERVKPDPELYRLALEGLRVAPDEAIALEDSANGVLAARGAGIRCVWVPNPITAEMRVEAEHVVRDPGDLDLQSLLAVFSSGA